MTNEVDAHAAGLREGLSRVLGETDPGDAGARGGRSILDLFDDSVRRSDIVDALDQMQQPRDAFKFLYALVQEHCSNVTEEEGDWRISKTTLDLVRKRQVDRKEGMLRGTLPG